jgi:hypothetical protein
MKMIPAFAMVRGLSVPERRSVLGEPVGPFVIYSDADLSNRKHCRELDSYHVTHAATGYSVAKSKTKKIARTLARKLAACGADWSFSEPEAVKAWPKEWTDAVRAINGRSA